MLTTVEGIYQDGEITLQETLREVKNGKVLVTFLNDA
jgi:hypothetical protein